MEKVFLTVATGINNRNKRSAFTLFELLLAMGILLILAGMTVGLAEGLQRRSARSKAISELALLAQALDSYKSHYGDYPWVEPGSEGWAELYAALIGHRGPTGGFAPGAEEDGGLLARRDPLASLKGRHFINLGQFQTANNPVPSSGEQPASLDVGYANNHFIDPWGSPYVYHYKEISNNPQGDDWKRPGFLLMSLGPDEIEGTGLPPDGIFSARYFENENSRDNIISGL